MCNEASIIELLAKRIKEITIFLKKINSRNFKNLTWILRSKIEILE